MIEINFWMFFYLELIFLNKIISLGSSGPVGGWVISFRSGLLAVAQRNITANQINFAVKIWFVLNILKPK